MIPTADLQSLKDSLEQIGLSKKLPENSWYYSCAKQHKETWKDTGNLKTRQIETGIQKQKGKAFIRSERWLCELK